MGRRADSRFRVVRRRRPIGGKPGVGRRALDVRSIFAVWPQLPVTISDPAVPRSPAIDPCTTAVRNHVCVHARPFRTASECA